MAADGTAAGPATGQHLVMPAAGAVSADPSPPAPDRPEIDPEMLRRFDAAAGIAACLMQAPIAAVAISEGGRLFVPCCHGLAPGIDPARLFLTPIAGTETVAFDPGAEPQWADHPLVAEPPHLRFHATAPLLLRDGAVAGGLVVASPVPPAPRRDSLRALRDLAGALAAELDLRRERQRLRAELAEHASLADALRLSQQRMSDYVAACSDVMWETDSALRMSAGEGPATVTGRGFDSVRGRYLIETLESDMAGRGRFDQLLEEMTARRRFRGFEFSRTLPDGTQIWLEINGVPHFAADGTFLGYRGVTRNITRRKLAEEQVQRLAQEDYLTGLPNRRAFQARLELVLGRAAATQQTAALLLVDLDHFKQINDTLGHDAGDALLREVARRLSHGLRTRDIAARFGGDEYVVLLDCPSGAEAVQAVVPRLLADIGQPVTIAGREIRPGATVGVALLPADAQTPEAAVKAADVALYRAKSCGRGTWSCFGDVEATAAAGTAPGL